MMIQITSSRTDQHQEEPPHRATNDLEQHPDVVDRNDRGPPGLPPSRTSSTCPREQDEEDEIQMRHVVRTARLRNPPASPRNLRSRTCPSLPLGCVRDGKRQDDGGGVPLAPRRSPQSSAPWWPLRGRRGPAADLRSARTARGREGAVPGLGVVDDRPAGTPGRGERLPAASFSGAPPRACVSTAPEERRVGHPAAERRRRRDRTSRPVARGEDAEVGRRRPRRSRLSHCQLMRSTRVEVDQPVGEVGRAVLQGTSRSWRGRADDQAHAWCNPAGSRELAHPRVNQGEAGAARAPRRERDGVVPPRHRRELGPPWLR